MGHGHPPPRHCFPETSGPTLHLAGIGSHRISVKTLATQALAMHTTYCVPMCSAMPARSKTAQPHTTLNKHPVQAV
eukprot:9327338-Heterocapsa_arctica.AAC.1